MLPILIEPNGDKDFQETKNFAVTSGDAFVAKSLAEKLANEQQKAVVLIDVCLLYTSPSPRDRSLSRMPSSA